ncbi:MAG TPA: L,D-transpeptidase [Chitinophagaceae bacterium]|jgi:murein L,D-transpeptidase YafK|nr:L,D-transpeptidase [Chitinophagaceae bacterium]
MKTFLVLASIIAGSSVVATHNYTDNNPDKNRSKNSAPVGTVYIVIDKSDYELSLYDQLGWYATFPVVFGNSSLSDKKMEGDKNTPEGTFHIASKRVHDKWHRFMALDYPTKESWEKFNQRKSTGEIPPSAKIGGSIGIHGTWPHEDFQIDRYKNWTMGCISMKNEDVEDLYKYVPIGTKIIIRP